jgi:hypothetical protein
MLAMLLAVLAVLLLQRSNFLQALALLLGLATLALTACGFILDDLLGDIAQSLLGLVHATEGIRIGIGLLRLLLVRTKVRMSCARVEVVQESVGAAHNLLASNIILTSAGVAVRNHHLVVVGTQKCIYVRHLNNA